MRLKSGLAVGAMLLVMAVPGARAQDEGAQLQTLVDKVSPSIVTVKMLLKSGDKEADQSAESRLEIPGVVVDADGLIMISNIPMSPARIAAALGGGEAGDADMKSTPSEIKIVFEQEEKEYTAFVAATDAKSELAFLKIEDLAGRKLTPVDFSGTTSPAIGQKVVAVSRMAKGYDYAPYFASSRISGLLVKPRKAYVLDGSISEIGLPLFTLTGEAVGAISIVESSVKNENAQSSASFTMAMRYMFGGGLVRPFLVPSATINGLIGQAKQRAVTVAAERAKTRAAPKTEPVKPVKPAAPKKP